MPPQHPPLYERIERKFREPKTRLFISFDFENDEDLRNLLVGQSKHPDSPFDIIDCSIKEPLTGDWKTKFRQRIRNVDTMAVICGVYTRNASGVNVEVRIAQEEQVPYFLLEGRSARSCFKPLTAHPGDKMYNWTWDNLKQLVRGLR